MKHDVIIKSKPQLAATTPPPVEDPNPMPAAKPTAPPTPTPVPHPAPPPPAPEPDPAAKTSKPPPAPKAQPPAPTPDAPAPEPKPAPPPPVDWPSIKLNGIVGSGDVGAVLLDNKIVELNDTVDGIRILSVESHGACSNTKAKNAFLRSERHYTSPSFLATPEFWPKMAFLLKNRVSDSTA